MFYENEFAVIGTPTNLMISIITASVICSILLYSIITLSEESQTHLVKKQIDKIRSDAENMFEYANSGSKLKIDVKFPESMRFAVFGKIPDDTLKPSNFELDKNMSNNYYFIMENGDICTYSSNARFCGNSTDRVAVLNNGEYSIYLELVCQDGMTYVKIY